MKNFIFTMIGIFATVNADITYEFSGGRLGDNLLSYLHAKWIAYKTKQRLLYRPFPHAEKFAFSTKEARLSTDHNKGKTFRLQADFGLHLRGQILYKVPYFSDFEHEYPKGYYDKSSPFVVNWQDARFKQIIRESLAPLEEPNDVIVPPESFLSVAMHVRKGGNYETWNLAFDQLKFPPISFFAEQLAFICRKYPEKRVYAFIFTDDLNPAEIAREIAESVKDYDVILDYRPFGTDDTSYILDDFFSIPLFQILIRPCSNYSYVAGKLGDYLMEISPKKYVIDGEIVRITAVDVIERGGQ